ncbi:MAG: FliA/WhiG family RNA polymerase sigma factor [Nitrospiria bacterium]
MSESTNAAVQNQPGVDALLVEFAPMIRMVAHRLAFRLPPTLDVEDLVHAGIIGLMDALDRYDPTNNTRFRTYAEFRIRGAMLDEIRSLDWIPRSVHEKTVKLRKTSQKLLVDLGRPPSEDELREALGMDQEAFDNFLLQASATTLLSLEELGVREGSEWNFIESMADPDTADPLLALLSETDKNKLIKAIEALPKKERLVISLYYDEELTMKEVGQIMKVSESRICQIHTKAILRLKGIIGGRH